MECVLSESCYLRKILQMNHKKKNHVMVISLEFVCKIFFVKFHGQIVLLQL